MCTGRNRFVDIPGYLKRNYPCPWLSKDCETFKKRGISQNDILEKLQKIIKVAIIIPGNLVINHIQSDPSDNIMLACAIEGMADYIVSGDHHLTDLKSFQGIPIVNPDMFLKNLFAHQPG